VSTSAWVGAVAGMMTGAVTAFFGWIFTRKDTQKRLELAEQQSKASVEEASARTQKINAETQQILQHIEQARTEAVASVVGAASYAASDTDVVVVYDGRDRVNPFDFRQESEDGASARISEDAGMLVIERRKHIGPLLPLPRALRERRRPRQAPEPGRRRGRDPEASRAVRGASRRHRAHGAAAPHRQGRVARRVSRPAPRAPRVVLVAEDRLVSPDPEHGGLHLPDRHRSVSEAPSTIQIRKLVITERH
jgi:hypothetical protein